MNKWVKGGVLLLLIAGIGWAALHRGEWDARALEAWVRGVGWWGPLLFILSYALATILFLPGSLLTLTGGALFGPLLGTLYNLVGATLGATAAFVIARYLAGDWVARRSGERLSRIMAGVEAEGWRFVAFVRLVPLFPFNLLNYALGLTPIRLWHYVLASFICMAPGGFAYTYLGYAGREAAAGGGDLLKKGVLALSLLAAVALIPTLVRHWRKEGGTGEGEGGAVPPTPVPGGGDADRH